MTYINIDDYEHIILDDGEIVFKEAVYLPLPYTEEQMDIKEVYYCNDCAEFADLAVFKDKYVCPSCGVYDEETGEA